MSESVKMPALGESVTEGTVTQWLKAEGDRIEVDEPLLEVSTDKVDTEVPSPVAGVLEKILVQEDETVEVGAELAVIGDGSGAGDGAAETENAPATDGEPDTAPAPQSAPASETVEAAQPAAEDAKPAAEAKAEVTGDGGTAADGGTAGDGEPAGQAVTMPALGESVTEGTVTQWLKAEGDTVEVDEPLLEVSTDKVDTEVPSPVAGTVLKILVGEDETVEVGAQLAIVGEPGAAPQAPAQPTAEPAQQAPAQPEQPEEPAQQAPAQPEQPAQPEEPAQPERPARAEQPAQAQQPGQPEQREQARAEAEAPEAVKPAPVPPGAQTQQAAAPKAEAAGAGSYVTPLVRKLAGDLGVDLASVTGTGVGGRIRRQDVEAAAERAAAERAAAEQAAQPAPAAAAPAAPARKPVEPSPLRGTTEKMSRLRKVIAKRMVESLQTSAQLTTVVEVDVTRIGALRSRARDAFQAAEGTKLTFLPFFVKAATEALKAHPKVNATIEGETVVYHGSEHIGIAVDTERGLLVPVIKDAGDLNVGGIAKRINDLAARTRDNKVTPDELSGSTFTITNTGSGGALFDTPIINQPEVAILGVGTIVKRPMVVKDADGNETIGVRSMVYLALSYDHRLVDGADAARYLMAVKARLEEGAFDAEVGL
ncbi:2-oxoglutarate dehydrogenase, E2 component, dihydrolipoamide succinyltransferase [Georgenia sp. TF02-10]|uniref:2-oxoglutarate dehydrogenase, E2 component, dihydrolipoamide succinyltransferase n=1 Tax=Georgenia sp. TF02-10 TaxID=2917725 RepID=UPI001FA763C1|nr:2-oxoglutarate dehydrogenase, E2 component, dihydrolipoamide succinyltransferase [Georgenia sp. TF02-10]UNX53441.1 2-oxoglutarate dehydrogenase, E2 component, dihydrolipoamide succinyltransferase [Georgenia sp. TF02-10]